MEGVQNIDYSQIAGDPNTPSPPKQINTSHSTLKTRAKEKKKSDTNLKYFLVLYCLVK